MSTVGHVYGPFSGTVVQLGELPVTGIASPRSKRSTLLVLTICSAGAESSTRLMVTFACPGRIMVQENAGPRTSEADS